MSPARIDGRIPVALVVDDDAMMRLLIRQALEPAGFACHEAPHGAAAMECFDVVRPTSCCWT